MSNNQRTQGSEQTPGVPARSADALDGANRRELIPLAVLLIVAGLALLFILLAGEVLHGDTTTFDRAILMATRDPANPSQPLGSPTVQNVARDITASGGVALLTFITPAVVVYLLLIGRQRVALYVIVAIGGGAIISYVLKTAINRPRPELFQHLAYVTTASFPSGHSMLSATTYLTLGALLANLQKNRRVKAYLIGLAIFITIAVGLSRIYLAVHWPTDVLAGWTAGASWALVCGFVAYSAKRRTHIE